MSATDELRTMYGLKKIKLKDEDDNEREYKLKPIKIKDFLYLLSAVGDEEKLGELEGRSEKDVEMGELKEYITAIANISEDLLQTTYPDLEKDVCEIIVSNNIGAFTKYIFDQTKRINMSDDTRKKKKLRHAGK